MAMTRCLFVLVMASIATTQIKAQNSPVLTINNLINLLSEDETSVTTLDTITCADTNEFPFPSVTAASITYTPTTNCPSCLRLEPQGGSTTDYDLKFYPSAATFDFSQASIYTITVTCTDFTDADATGTIDVRLTPNSYPTFDNGLAVSTTQANAKSVVSGDTVYTVAATDPDGDSVFYTMTMTPSTAYFSIGYANGIIKATDALNKQCDEYIIFNVTITDLKLANPDNQIIVLTLGSYNRQPTTNDLPGTFIIQENQIGQFIHTVDIDDDDTSELSVSFTVNPASSQTKLTFIQTFFSYEIGTLIELDYEDPTENYNVMTILLDDGNCPVSTYSYTVIVTDVNEVPTLDPLAYTYEEYEGNIVLDPQWTTTDPDANDTLTYSIKSMSPAGLPFQIDANTGIITSIGLYDIDQGVNVATVTFTVEVTDSGGLTADTTVTLNIKDLNDNAPVFDANSLHVQVAATDCSTYTTGVVGTLVATDLDSTFQDNNVISYHLASTSSTFAISEHGEIILLTVPAVGTVETVKANAIDAGQHPGNLTSIVSSQITVTVTTCPTTTVATTTSAASSGYSGFSLEDNVWWIALAGLFFILFAALLTWLCLTRIIPFCRNPPPGHFSVAKIKCCKRQPQPSKPKPKRTFKDIAKKVAPVSNKPKPGNDGFWKVVQDVINKPSPLTDSDRGPDRFKGPQGHDANRVHSPTQAPPLDDPLSGNVNRNYQEGFF